MKKSLTFIVLVCIIIGGLLLYIFFPSNFAHAPTTSGELMGNAAQKADKIRVTIPTPNASISSPVSVVGQARGMWFFEASFPVEVRNASGKVIGRGIAQAQGDWMTEDFVPFTASIVFSAPSAGTKGMLVLKKDNPSGDPAKDEELDVPVQFVNVIKNY